ncbi:hypothetical protein MHH62_13875 [Pseudomonas sp. FSL L8-0168]|uniref:hypothetical protein n=1 Tax=Pseudomonas sp. FSL L8-0168 TaxID=2921518 RepID=UPI0030DBFB13
MLLAKSCHRKDHIASRKTLRLGTLAEYRETEIQQIADRHEGTLTFDIKFKGLVNIEPRWFNTLFAGAIHIGSHDNEPVYSLPGRSTVQVDHIEYVGPSMDLLTVKDSSATITREATDSFIFCMSSIRRTHECIGMFADYDAYWYVKSLHAHSFGKALGRILRSTIKERHASCNYLVPKDTCMKTLNVFLEVDSVIYTGRNIEISNNSIIPLREYMRRMETMTYLKPVEFQHEKEMRFRYIIVSEGKIISPIVKSVILDAETLLPYVFYFNE